MKKTREDNTNKYSLGEICSICGKINVTDIWIPLSIKGKKFYGDIDSVEDIKEDYPEYNKVIDYPSEGLK